MKKTDQQFIELCKKVQKNQPLTKKELTLFIGLSLAIFIETKKVLNKLIKK